MIKFFRNIRRKLLQDNRASKYFLYAIGEILLVVIGILIALQINNWNEERKINIEEIKLLHNFKSSIEADTARVNNNIRDFKRRSELINTLLRHINMNLPYHDSLSVYFMNSTAIWMPRLDQEVFATLTSADLNIISNDELKNNILAYYSFAKRLFDTSVSRYHDVMASASNNILNTRFDGLWNTRNRAMIPYDYEALKKDKEYKYFLNSLDTQL